MVYAFCWACAVDETVRGRGVVGESAAFESCCGSVGFVVMNDASDRECTLTSESDVVEAWSEEDS